ncbi:hypothetical protein [Chryseobacterium sp.]|uniref:hypothetical protein n=1 Tax=Chryseobacterium sp. TaxID=1871047 RepID=UPI00289C3934|nr:hypothetical protein [Chryseobacterium sp.]
MRVELSQTAKNSLEEIIFFLKTKWTQKELDHFRNDIKKFKKTIEEKIIVHRSLENFPDIKYMLIGKKQVKIFYEKRGFCVGQIVLAL